MTKASTNTILRDIEGKKLEAGDPKKVLTFKSVVVNALLMGPDQPTLDGAAKLMRWELAKRIQGKDEVELEAEEVVMIKESVSKSYTSLIYGRVAEVLGEAEE